MGEHYFNNNKGNKVSKESCLPVKLLEEYGLTLTNNSSNDNYSCIQYELTNRPTIRGQSVIEKELNGTIMEDLNHPSSWIKKKIFINHC